MRKGACRLEPDAAVGAGHDDRASGLIRQSRLRPLGDVSTVHKC
jgi:hypothetical protein